MSSAGNPLMSLFSKVAPMMPGFDTNFASGGQSNASPFGNFDFGAGGIFNGFNQAAVPAGAQGQSSGGFNTMPGMPGSNGGSNGGGTFGIPGGTSFTGNGTNNNLNPSIFFGSGTNGNPGNLPSVNGSVFKDLYGHGVGDALQQFLNNGAGFNQGVVTAEQNAAMPLEQRALAQMSNMFGSNGLASSSTAALAYGDFESQFNASLEGMFAQQYEQSVQNYLKVLTGTQQDAKENNAQQGNWMNTVSQVAGAVLPFFL